MLLWTEIARESYAHLYWGVGDGKDLIFFPEVAIGLKITYDTGLGLIYSALRVTLW